MTWRWTDRVALGCFVAALFLLVGFHVLPLYEEHLSNGSWRVTPGWTVWPHVVGDLVDVENLEFESAGPSFALALGIVVALASPFLIRILSVNRVVWWSVASASGLLVVGLTGVLGIQALQWWHVDDSRIASGYLCVATFPIVHLLGVLFVRRRARGIGIAPGEAGR